MNGLVRDQENVVSDVFLCVFVVVAFLHNISVGVPLNHERKKNVAATTSFKSCNLSTQENMLGKTNFLCSLGFFGMAGVFLREKTLSVCLGASNAKNNKNL